MDYLTIITGFMIIGSLHYLIRSIQKTYHKKSFIDISRIYETMAHVVNETRVDRFLILYTTNGGGIPHVGSQLFGSVLYEVHNTNIRSIKMEWQKVRIDQEYMELLVRVYKSGNKGVLLRTMEMAPGLLQSVYLRDGVTNSYVLRLKDTKKKFYYVALQTTAKEGIMDLATIQMAVSKLQTIFKNAR